VPVPGSYGPAADEGGSTQADTDADFS
jgi:hypothetical protein